MRICPIDIIKDLQPREIGYINLYKENIQVRMFGDDVQGLQPGIRGKNRVVPEKISQKDVAPVQLFLIISLMSSNRFTFEPMNLIIAPFIN